MSAEDGPTNDPALRPPGAGILAPLILDESTSVLAVGPGAAGLVRAMADRGARVVAVTADAPALEAADDQPAIELVPATLDAWLGARDRTGPRFDLVVYDAVTAAVADGDPDATLVELIEAAPHLLSPSGTLLLTVDRPWGLGHMLRPGKVRPGPERAGPGSSESSAPATSDTVLDSTLAARGFTRRRTLLPYPDSREPEVIVDARLWEEPDGDPLARLFVRTPVADPGPGRILVSDPIAAFQQASEAGLAPAVSDSSIVIAGRGEWPDGSVLRHGYLWQLSPADRRPEWQVVRELRTGPDGWQMAPTGSGEAVVSGPLALEPLTVDIPVGRSGEDVIADAFIAEGPFARSSHDTLRAWWGAAVAAVEDSRPERIQIDVRPRNFIVTTDGAWRFVPQDLTWRFGLHQGVIAYRALRHLVDDGLRRRGEMKDVSLAMTIDQAVRAIMDTLDLRGSEEYAYEWGLVQTDIAARTRAEELDRDAYETDLRDHGATPLWAHRLEVPLDRRLERLLHDGEAVEIEEWRRDIAERGLRWEVLQRELDARTSAVGRIRQDLERRTAEAAALRRELTYRTAEIAGLRRDIEGGSAMPPAQDAPAQDHQAEEHRDELAWRAWQGAYAQALEQAARDGEAGQARIDAARDRVAGSDVFDGDWYLARYPDVDEAGMDPASHFVLHGASEGRDPGPDFDTRAYVVGNEEVIAGGLNPVVHLVATTDEAEQDG